MDWCWRARRSIRPINYRSVVVLGKARPVTDLDEKREALRRFTNHVIAGRWEQAKQPTDQELKATSVLALPLEEVSAKIRTGPPIDDEEDYALPVWGGRGPGDATARQARARCTRPGRHRSARTLPIVEISHIRPFKSYIVRSAQDATGLLFCSRLLIKESVI